MNEYYKLGPDEVDYILTPREASKSSKVLYSRIVGSGFLFFCLVLAIAGPIESIGNMFDGESIILNIIAIAFYLFVGLTGVVYGYFLLLMGTLIENNSIICNQTTNKFSICPIYEKKRLFKEPIFDSKYPDLSWIDVNQIESLNIIELSTHKTELEKLMVENQQLNDLIIQFLATNRRSKSDKYYYFNNDFKLIYLIVTIDGGRELLPLSLLREEQDAVNEAFEIYKLFNSTAIETYDLVNRRETVL